MHLGTSVPKIKSVPGSGLTTRPSVIAYFLYWIRIIVRLIFHLYYSPTHKGYKFESYSEIPQNCNCKLNYLDNSNSIKTMRWHIPIITITFEMILFVSTKQ